MFVSVTIVPVNRCSTDFDYNWFYSVLLRLCVWYMRGMYERYIWEVYIRGIYERYTPLYTPLYTPPVTLYIHLRPPRLTPCYNTEVRKTYILSYLYIDVDVDMCTVYVLCMYYCLRTMYVLCVNPTKGSIIVEKAVVTQ